MANVPITTENFAKLRTATTELETARREIADILERRVRPFQAVGHPARRRPIAESLAHHDTGLLWLANARNEIAAESNSMGARLHERAADDGGTDGDSDE